jgi:hypothetical protein
MNINNLDLDQELSNIQFAIKYLEAILIQNGLMQEGQLEEAIRSNDIAIKLAQIPKNHYEMKWS